MSWIALILYLAICWLGLRSVQGTKFIKNVTLVNGVATIWKHQVQINPKAAYIPYAETESETGNFFCRVAYHIYVQDILSNSEVSQSVEQLEYIVEMLHVLANSQFTEEDVPSVEQWFQTQSLDIMPINSPLMFRKHIILTLDSFLRRIQVEFSERVYQLVTLVVLKKIPVSNSLEKDVKSFFDQLDECRNAGKTRKTLGEIEKSSNPYSGHKENYTISRVALPNKFGKNTGDIFEGIEQLERYLYRVWGKDIDISKETDKMVFLPKSVLEMNDFFRKIAFHIYIENSASHGKFVREVKHLNYIIAMLRVLARPNFHKEEYEAIRQWSEKTGHNSIFTDSNDPMLTHNDLKEILTSMATCWAETRLDSLVKFTLESIPKSHSEVPKFQTIEQFFEYMVRKSSEVSNSTNSGVTSLVNKQDLLRLHGSIYDPTALELQSSSSLSSSGSNNKPTCQNQNNEMPGSPNNPKKRDSFTISTLQPHNFPSRKIKKLDPNYPKGAQHKTTNNVSGESDD